MSTPFTNKAAIREELRGLGLRATAPRVAVLRLLRSSPRPLSHSEVVDQLQNDDWDRATVFRNLVKLSATGLTRVASQVGGVTRYEAVREDESEHVHAHFSCRQCGKVSCLEDIVLPTAKDRQWQAALEEAEVQVVGTCPCCREKSPSA